MVSVCIEEQLKVTLLKIQKQAVELYLTLNLMIQFRKSLQNLIY